MKNIILSLFLLIHLSSFSQSKITYLYDKGLLNKELEQLLSSKLLEYQLQYSPTIILNKKCEYHFASLKAYDNLIYLDIKNCVDTLFGTALLGNLDLIKKPQDYVNQIAFLSHDIIKNPDKYKNTKIEAGHVLASRYYVGHSAFNLKKEDAYININNLLYYNIEYAASDHISFGLGTTLVASPFFLNFKVGLNVGKKSHIAFGNILALGTNNFLKLDIWDPPYIINMPFLTYTYGHPKSNISLGLAYLESNSYLRRNKLSQPVFNISALGKLSKKSYIISENYFTFGKNRDHDYLGIYDNYTKISEKALGVLGYRIMINKKMTNSFQFGMAYYFNHFKIIIDDFPNATENKLRTYVIPTMSCSFKL